MYFMYEILYGVGIRYKCDLSNFVFPLKLFFTYIYNQFKSYPNRLSFSLKRITENRLVYHYIYHLCS